MTTVADVGFAEMRLGKVVAITTADGDPSCCVVLDAVSQDRHLLLPARISGHQVMINGSVLSPPFCS